MTAPDIIIEYNEFLAIHNDETRRVVVGCVNNALKDGLDLRSTVKEINTLLPDAELESDFISSQFVYASNRKLYNDSIKWGAKSTSWQRVRSNKDEDVCTFNESAGHVALGLEYPSGHLIPPAHIACTCLLIAQF